MKVRRYRPDGIMTRQAARRIVRPHAKLLGLVLHDAWQAWCQFGAVQPDLRARLGSSARAFDLADFIKYEMIRRFTKVGGCQLDMPYGRPELALADGELRMKFGKINLDPASRPTTDRQLSIYFQEDAVAARLPDMPRVTWVKCGYLLDPSAAALLGALVTCEQDGVRLWQLSLPLPAVQNVTQVAGLSVASVPPAKISSARGPASADTGAASSD